MAYVDGFLLPVPKRNLAAYARLSKKAGKIWRELGALDYKECAGDDLEVKKSWGVAFPRLLRLKRGEVPVFAFIVYKSRAHRDRVNAKVMADPRMRTMMHAKKMPFDIKKMAYGGFKVIVDVT